MNLQFLFERLRAAGIVVVIYSSSLFGGTDEGVLAARQGNFKLALQELTAAANQGDVEAANYAASIYLNGPPVCLLTTQRPLDGIGLPQKEAIASPKIISAICCVWGLALSEIQAKQ